MGLLDILNNKKIRVIEIPKWGHYLRNQWEFNFANHLTLEEKKAIYLHNASGARGYLWHLFSYEKKNCFKEAQAEIAFNNEPKSTCFVFYQHFDYALILEKSSMFTVDDLFAETDIYIVDREFNWTYVKTHETGRCGPYFARKVKCP
ncbi:DUF4275 family protein [Paenibacillus sp. LMG 31456]|uniref:DUF4275 family protein n=1 Tax=Paenibacillus foliorum TaxID=2654974 RepID=A0A972GQK8_9BACL|nr:DUF4275 family protein [Paenibacillus foliorum]NOU94588.1 DUF4275 family protein [Paenibacillus foliorum]